MLGLLFSLIDIGILTHGNVNAHAESSMNRKSAKKLGFVYYRDGFGRYRSTETNHIVTVTREGVRDTKTGILIDDYKEKRKKELEKIQEREKERINTRIIFEKNNPQNKDKTWTYLSVINREYNLKTGIKAVLKGDVFKGTYGYFEDEYGYYVDHPAFYLSRLNRSDDIEEKERKFFIEGINSKVYVDSLYETYLKNIKFNNELFEKYKNKEFIEKNNIELVPVSREEFINKFEKV